MINVVMITVLNVDLEKTSAIVFVNVASVILVHVVVMYVLNAVRSEITANVYAINVIKHTASVNVDVLSAVN